MNQNLLRNALRANAIFSAICGFELLFFNRDLAKILGVAEINYLLILGGGLIVFSIILLLVSREIDINIKMAKAITYMDGGWVLGSIILLVFGHDVIPMVGKLLIGCVAFIVGLCAYIQMKGISQTNIESIGFPNGEKP